MRRDEPSWVPTFLLAGAFLALLAVPVLAWQSFWTRITFGGPLEPEAKVHSDHLMVAALIIAVVAPVVGIAAGWWLRSTGSIVVMTVVLSVTVALGLFAVIKTYHPPEPDPWPTHCQEHSGGGNECPGD
ncbi:hypothetical protein [Cryptosporangium sp. NPDC051539]|uniref:hypothetical protein n=1 Tax=Cryptosporangium sp. NPDC051539 TaxID=3363962 RepID=UPI0037B32471